MRTTWSERKAAFELPVKWWTHFPIAGRGMAFPIATRLC